MKVSVDLESEDESGALTRRFPMVARKLYYLTDATDLVSLLPFPFLPSDTKMWN